MTSKLFFLGVVHMNLDPGLILKKLVDIQVSNWNKVSSMDFKPEHLWQYTVILYKTGCSLFFFLSRATTGTFEISVFYEDLEVSF